MGVATVFGVISSSLILKDETTKTITYLMPIITFWIMLFFVSIYASIGTLIINALILFAFPFVLQKMFFSINDNGYLWTLISVGYWLAFLLYVAKFYFKKMSRLIQWSLVTVLLLAIGSFYLTSKNDLNVILYELIQLTMFLATGYVIYGLITLIDQIYSHAIQLRNIISFDNKYYINNTISDEFILDFIIKKNNTQGIFLSFFISNYDKFEKLVNSNIKDYILNHITNEVHDIFFEEYKEDIIFFKINYKLYGMFISVKNLSKEDVQKSYDNNIYSKRNKDDFLFKIQQLFSKVKVKFKEDKFIFKVNLKSIVSLYGIHSNSLETLSTYNNYFASNEQKYSNYNQIILINPIEFNNNIRLERKMLSLSEVIPINQNSTLYQPIYSIQKNTVNKLFLNNMIDGQEVFSSEFNSSREKIKDYGLYSVFIRYLANQAIQDIETLKENVEDKKLFLNYDSQFLSSGEFEIGEFITKLKSKKITLQKLILTFDLKNEIQNHIVLQENIVQLKKFGIKIALFNFGGISTNISDINLFKPEYLFIEEEIISRINSIKENEEIIHEMIKISNKLEIKLIAIGVNTYLIYNKLKKMGLKYVSGELIGSSSTKPQSLNSELLFLLSK